MAVSNGVVALKPTHGLLSRNGIIPLALTFDTGGPFGRKLARQREVLDTRGMKGLPDSGEIRDQQVVHGCRRGRRRCRPRQPVEIDDRIRGPGLIEDRLDLVQRRGLARADRTN